VKLSPGSSRDKISGWLGDSLKIRVCAAAESGKANAAVIRLLSGTRSTRKIIEISGLTEAEVYARPGIDSDWHNGQKSC